MMRHPSEIQYIAEISANHLGSFERALSLVEAAASAGATAVKFQTYTADTMTLDLPELSVSADHELWGGRSLYSLYEEAATPWEWHKELFSRCRELGVIPFSSPFDLTAVDFLEDLNVEMYKIASLETSDLELIEKVAKTGKPMYVSTGATKLEEIEDLVQVVKECKNNNLTLLVCTSSYPTLPREAHVRRIVTLQEKFKVNVGISDHTLGIGVSVAAISLGATAVEKHITLNRSDGGADGAFSMEPEEFALLVKEGTAAHESLGNGKWEIQASENESRRLRRSLYIVEEVKKGETISKENVKPIRPGFGCSPKFFGDLLGKTFNRDLARGTPMHLDYAD